MRLLKLDPIIQTGMRDGFVSMGHGRALVNIEKKKTQISIYETIVAQGLSVRETEQLVKSFKKNKGETTSKNKIVEKKLPEYITKNIDAITKNLSVKVAITSSANGKGKIVIPFHSKEEFKRLKKILTSD